MGRFICAETPGNADVLELRDRPTPSPAAGQVTVSQTKIGLNFLDVYQTSGVYPFPENDVFVPGNEGVGKVLAVGEGVTGFKEGDRVGYPMVVGAFAEERVIAADRLVQLPDNVSDDMAAATMLKGMTVEYLLTRSVPLHAGDTVLFHAAAGGVGLLAGQWLKAIGVTSIGTAGSKDDKQMSYDDMYNARLNINKEKISQGRAPTQTGTKVFNARDNMNVLSKRQNASIPTDKTLRISRVSQQARDANEENITSYRTPLSGRGQQERFNPTQLNMLRRNPYAIYRVFVYNANLQDSSYI